MEPIGNRNTRVSPSFPYLEWAS